MWKWIKAKSDLILIVVVTVLFGLFAYACEPKEPSLLNRGVKVTRAEFEVELNQLLALADLRIVGYEKQERIRAIILQNAMVLVQGQPVNPIGILTGIASIYGITQATKQTTKVIKHARDKRNNKKPVT